METQQAVEECKELIAKLKVAAMRIMVDRQFDLRPMHKLVLCLRQRMREIQHKTESLKDQCAKARDDADTLTLEVEKVNYLREAYRTSIERAEKQPTPEMDKLGIDPTQDAETVQEALDTERKARLDLMQQLEEEQAALKVATATRQELAEKLRKFREMASKVQDTAAPLKTFVETELRTRE